MPKLTPLALALALPLACSRSLPDPPPESPLSSTSSAPAPRSVDVALTSDPPLPGEPSEGWDGLPKPKKGGGHEHHGHHGHGKPAEAPTTEVKHDH